jgi:hypothetical protein
MFDRLTRLRLLKSKVPLFVVLIVAGCVCLTIFVFASQTSRTRNDVPAKNRLKWHASEAKKEGKQQIEIPTRTFEYLGSANKSLDDALQTYTVIIGQPTAKLTVQASDNDLLTWYKFNVLEVLTPVRTPPCPACMTLVPPANFPIGSNEIWIPRNGGKLNIDSVDIEQKESGFPPFENNDKYLMFLMWYPNNIAEPAGGPIGVFQITGAGKLKSFHTDSDTLKTEIQNLFASDLSELRKKTNAK